MLRHGKRGHISAVSNYLLGSIVRIYTSLFGPAGIRWSHPANIAKLKFALRSLNCGGIPTSEQHSVGANRRQSMAGATCWKVSSAIMFRPAQFARRILLQGEKQQNYVDAEVSFRLQTHYLRTRTIILTVEVGEFISSDACRTVGLVVYGILLRSGAITWCAVVKLQKTDQN